MKYVIAALLLSIFTTSASAAVLYRYKDENGGIVLGVTVPPEFAKNGYDVLSSTGRVIETIAPALTPEQIAEKNRIEREQEEEARLIAERKKADAALLKIYSHPDDAVRTLTRQLQDIVAVIKLKEGKIHSEKNKLSEAESQAADRERAGRKVTEAQLSAMQSISDEIKSIINEITRLENDYIDTVKQFQVTIDRLVEITGKEVTLDMPSIERPTEEAPST